MSKITFEQLMEKKTLCESKISEYGDTEKEYLESCLVEVGFKGVAVNHLDYDGKTVKSKGFIHVTPDTSLRPMHAWNLTYYPLTKAGKESLRNDHIFFDYSEDIIPQLLKKFTITERE